jgi:hypothetical protein
MDKHRDLHVIGCAITDYAVSMSGPTGKGIYIDALSLSQTETGCPLEDGAEILRYGLSLPDGQKMGVKTSFTFNVAIANLIWRPIPLEQVLQHVLDFTVNTVRIIEKVF